MALENVNLGKKHIFLIIFLPLKLGINIKSGTYVYAVMAK